MILKERKNGQITAKESEKRCKELARFEQFVRSK
jgi:hypothetical protein